MSSAHSVSTRVVRELRERARGAIWRPRSFDLRAGRRAPRRMHAWEASRVGY